MSEKLSNLLLPTDWAQKKLNEVAWYQEGPGLRKWQFTDEGIKVINITNMVGGVLKLDKTARYISIDEFNRSYKHFECNANDIVIASSGNSYCKHAIVRQSDLPLVMNTSVIRFQPTNGTDYNFLNQFLKSEFFKSQIDFLITGGAQPNFGPAHLAQVIVAYPPIEEQQKIASILSTVDEKIGVIEAQIAETQQLKKGLMQRLLTKGIGHTKFKDSPLGEIPEDWEVVKLGQFTKSFAGGTPLRSNNDYYNGSIAWIKSGEVKQRNISTAEEYITEKALKETAARLIEPDSLLIALYGATAGNVGMLRIPAASNQAVLAIRPTSQKLSSEFLYHFLGQATPSLLRLTQGSGQPNLSKSIIDNLNIPCPSITEQQRISDLLSSVDDKLDILKNRSEDMGVLKKGLMQKLLTGKIRVKH